VHNCTVGNASWYLSSVYYKSRTNHRTRSNHDTHTKPRLNREFGQHFCIIVILLLSIHLDPYAYLNRTHGTSQYINMCMGQETPHESLSMYHINHTWAYGSHSSIKNALSSSIHPGRKQWNIGRLVGSPVHSSSTNTPSRCWCKCAEIAFACRKGFWEYPVVFTNVFSSLVGAVRGRLSLGLLAKPRVLLGKGLLASHIAFAEPIVLERLITRDACRGEGGPWNATSLIQSNITWTYE